MMKRFLTKLKIMVKRWLGRLVYFVFYLKKKIPLWFKQCKDVLLLKKKPENVVAFLFERWKSFLILVFLILGGYYGIGGLVSSKMHDQLNVAMHTNVKTGGNTVYALAYIIKSQVDESVWTPGLPIIFPAAAGDNLPNFQLGVKDSVGYLLKKLAKRFENEHLKEAAQLLAYPADIWLFSQTKDDKIAPGSAKQYRKALAEIEKSLPELDDKNVGGDNLKYSLRVVIKLLEKEIAKLNKHIREHSGESLDFRADDVFYAARGVIYTLHYFISGIGRDYQREILLADEYEDLTEVLKVLDDALKINPVAVKNASLDESYVANHLMYLSYYLARAQSLVLKILNVLGADKTE